MKKEIFLNLVMVEIDHIKEHATSEEKDKLNLETFDNSFGDKCIYGQMTGNCNTKRAKELYPKTFVDVPNFDIYIPFSKQSTASGTDLTALEKYLYMVKAPIHKQIIDYIKGLTTILILK